MERERDGKKRNQGCVVKATTIRSGSPLWFCLAFVFQVVLSSFFFFFWFCFLENVPGP